MFLIEEIKDTARLDNIIFKKHALTRMLERRIQSDEIIEVLLNFIIVEEYHDDKPLPSFLLLGFSKDRPLHVVISFDPEHKIIYVITIYEPATDLWESDLITRRRKT